MAGTPKPAQTLRALDRVSRGPVWQPDQPRDTWQHIGDVAARLVGKHVEASE